MNASRRPTPAACSDATKPQAARPAGTVPPPTTGARTPAPRSFDSDALFGPDDVVHIRHAGEVYRLQRTRLGKLILTK